MHCALLVSVPAQVDGPEMDNIAQVKCYFFLMFWCKKFATTLDAKTSYMS